MGKFDGILILSDLDGTLAVDGTVSEKNRKAIKYFCDNGGLFTICSGRNLAYIMALKDVISPNTYTVALNGAIIHDTETDVRLYEGFLEDDYVEILRKILNKNFYDRVIITFADDAEVVSFSSLSFEQDFKPYINRRAYKVLLISDSVEKSECGKDFASKMELGNYFCVRSWKYSLEILHKDNAKGKALRRLQQALNAKLTVAVGDYENDVEMLLAADISYAVDGACSEAVKAAKRRTSAPMDASIADIIYEIEAEFCS